MPAAGGRVCDVCDECGVGTGREGVCVLAPV